MPNYIYAKKLKYESIIDFQKFELLSSVKKKEYLIKHNIFVEGANPRDFFQDDDGVFDFNLDYGFDDDELHYNISNDIVNEFYEILKYYISFVADIEVQNDIDNISFKIDNFLFFEDKINYIRSKHIEYVNIFTNNIENKIFLDEPYNMYRNWKDFVLCSCNDLLFEYLTNGFSKIELILIKCIIPEGKKLNLDYDIIYKWEKLIVVKDMMDYCKSMIGSISSNSLKNAPDNDISQNNKINVIPKCLPEHLTVFNGENPVKLFFYIKNFYGGATNKAFFSYLFNFFLNKNLLISLNPKNYILFIEKQFGVRMSRIQEGTSVKAEEFEKIFFNLEKGFIKGKTKDSKVE